MNYIRIRGKEHVKPVEAVDHLPVHSPAFKGHVGCGASVSFVISPLGGASGNSCSPRSADNSFKEKTTKSYSW